jgi:guanylate kinase
VRNDQSRIDKLRGEFAGLAGQLVVISGPSAGAGKGKVIDELLGLSDEKLWLSVSMTTRQPRPGEVLHHKYTFVTPEEFSEREKAGEFLEANGLTEGARYGTPIAPLVEHMRQGETVMTEIEVNGGEFVHDVLPGELFIFIKPTAGDLADDLAELRRRIEKRGTNDGASIERRLDQAARELAQARELPFYTWIVNETGKSEDAAREIYNLIVGRIRTGRV